MYRDGLYRFFIVLILAGGIFSLPAGERSRAMAEELRVVELFTSQGCYSCPPAEAFLAELADEPDIIALEHHVDYWDSLVYGTAGRWKDPFSSPEATARQRDYNLAIRRKGAVYTPQMIIDGRLEMVGSRRAQVLTSLGLPGARELDVRLAVKTSGRGLAIDIVGPDQTPGGQSVPLTLVIYDKSHVTEVTRGENRGKTLTNRNVVRRLTEIGNWHGGATRLGIDNLVLEPGQGCALLLQERNAGPILAAANCPRPIS